MIAYRFPLRSPVATGCPSVTSDFTGEIASFSTQTGRVDTRRGFDIRAFGDEAIKLKAHDAA